MTLEEQLAALAELGLPLNPGIGVADLLVSHERSDFEPDGIELLTFAMGTKSERTPDGAYICDRVWDFDYAAIYGPGDYVAIAHRLAAMAGVGALLADLRDDVDHENGVAWLEYRIAGEVSRYEAVVDGDWADGAVVSEVLREMSAHAAAGAFYGLDDGQAELLFFLSDEGAAALIALGVAIQPLIPLAADSDSSED